MPDRDSLSRLPYLYVTSRGRVTGLPREIEIWFVASEGNLYILAERFDNPALAVLLDRVRKDLAV